MSNRSTVILGTGSYAPARVLTNDDLSHLVDTSDDWIQTRTGIRERRISAPDELASDMAVQAARRALETARVDASEIDLLIIATVTPDLPMPATACFVQQKLGLSPTTACFDLNAACSGFIYAMDTASAMIQSGRYRKALVVGVEKLSSVVDWEDRTTCVLFGDGAGAAVLGSSTEPQRGLLGFKLGAYGESADLLYIPRNGTKPVPTIKDVVSQGHCIKMKGKEVFKMAVRAMEESARDILEQQKVHADQISLVIPHQANRRIIDAISQYLELPMDRFYVNVDRFGNTSAASIPIALDEAHRAGKVKSGDLVLLVAFGAGLTYGSALIRW